MAASLQPGSGLRSNDYPYAQLRGKQLVNCVSDNADHENRVICCYE